MRSALAWALLQDRAQLQELAAAVKKDLHHLLENYDIEDKPTLRSIHGGLLTVALFEKDVPTAEKAVSRLRSLADKEADKLMTGQSTLAMIKAYRETGGFEGPAFEAAYQKHLQQALTQLPYEKIREKVEAVKGSIDMLSAQAIQSAVQGQFQPMLDKMGKTVPAQIAVGLIDTRGTLDYQVPLKEEIKAVYTAIYEANRDDSQPVDIWAARQFELPDSPQLQPVAIAIWDSGVDMAVFEDNRRYHNPEEKADGKDNDENGFIDDIHGIAYDIDNEKHPGLLLAPPATLTRDLATLQRLTKGSMDMQAGINDSPEAQEMIQTYSSLDAEALKTFMEEVGFYGLHAHGTHVAGIAADGNPAARIMGARFEYSTSTVPPPPTMESARAKAKMYREVVGYFKKSGVKVVNMSWRYGKTAYELLLSANGIGEDAEERKQMAREMFDIEKQALYQAIKEAPEILFVAGAGNEANSADFSEYIPASFELPNLITVGAVDTEGKRTSFTSEGKSVDCYANGYEVESFVPGGARLKFSGTSMASPQVANLAGKLLAVQPSLSVAQLRKLILEGCDESSEGIALLNPKQSLQLLARDQAAAGSTK